MDEKQKQQMMLAAAVFCFTFFGYVLYATGGFGFFVRALDFGGMTIAALIGAGIGIVTGVIAYFVGGMMNK